MKPMILLVEDDAVTRAFLVAAAEALPAVVETADDLASARSRLQDREYDLWLVDANLPDGCGVGWLAEMRAEGRRTPAIAHTAAHDEATIGTLRASGFVAVLAKPMTAATLQAAISGALGAQADDAVAVSSEPSAEIWNDAAALEALGGQRKHVDALRGLFLGELPAVGKAVAAAANAGDVAALGATLHKLRASCGFVGAARVETAVKALQAEPASAAVLARFLSAVHDTLSSA